MGNNYSFNIDEKKYKFDLPNTNWIFQNFY